MKHPTCFAFLFCSFLLVLNASQSANAMQLTWRLTGEVEIVESPFTDLFSVGDPVEYIFTFDSDAEGLMQDPYHVTYVNAVSTAQLTVGSYVATMESYSIGIVNNFYGAYCDVFGFQSKTEDTILTGDNLQGNDGYTWRFDGINGSFRDFSCNMLPSLELPTSPCSIRELAEEKSFGVVWRSGYYLSGVSATNLVLTGIEVCDNEIDDDCDDLIDTADPECWECTEQVDCDDNDECTINECFDHLCENSSVNCDDSNRCTDDLCDPTTGCASTCNATGPDDICCYDPACRGKPICKTGSCVSSAGASTRGPNPTYESSDLHKHLIHFFLPLALLIALGIWRVKILRR